MINLENIKKHLSDYGGKVYRADKENEGYDSRIHPLMGKSGRDAFGEFKGICDSLKSKISAKKNYTVNQWQNSGNMMDYFWGQFKSQKNKESPISISLFISKKELEVYIELDIKKCKDVKSKLRLYNRYVENLEEWIQLYNIDKDKYVIVYAHNNDKDNYKKRLSKFVNEKENPSDYFLRIGKVFSKNAIDINEIIQVFDELEYLYQLIVNINIDGEIVVSKPIEDQSNIIKLIDIEINDYLDNIFKKISGQGFNYSKDSLKNFYLSLKSKPFVILAGISGTGKSKLVKLFAKAIGAKYNLISVKPDWNDSTDLLGYKNLNDKFIPGQLTEIILEASKDENKDKPYFVCLDEMNLARVEYYFSEYLSLIESRERKDDDSIVTDKIFNSKDVEYNDLVFPDNLYIVGTVNMDDTTFGFSKKVLDRANTIEFSDVDLTLDFLNNSGEANEIVGADNSFLKTNFISLKELIHSNEIENKFIEDINNRIIEINNILKQYSRHFAYRVRDEILIYMAENKISNLFLEENSELTEEENEEISISKAFDYQIMQKILPLISGSDEYTRDILIDLFNYAFDKKERKEYIIDESNYRDKIDGIDLEKAKYKLTAKKLKDMLRGYDNGYATYWQ
ncbi:MAG: McrB family protein [Clostridium sp.]